MELTANSIIFITYITYYEKDSEDKLSDSRKTYPTVLNRNITVLNCHIHCYLASRTLPGFRDEMVSRFCTNTEATWRPCRSVLTQVQFQKGN
jgi:hypothetical protein